MAVMDDEELREALLSLTPAQQVAIEALVAGATHAVAAEETGVSRETVTRWISNHPASGPRPTPTEHLDEADLSTAIAVLRVLPLPPEAPPLLSASAVVDAALEHARAPQPMVYDDDLLGELSGEAARRRCARCSTASPTTWAWTMSQPDPPPYVPVERLNRLVKRHVLGLDLGPMTPAEEVAMGEIIVEMEAHPEREYWPANEW